MKTTINKKLRGIAVALLLIGLVPSGMMAQDKMCIRDSHYVDQFIQIVPIEYKKVLQEEQMRKLQQKIADMQRDY